MRASPHQPMFRSEDALGEVGGARLVDEEVVVVELDRVERQYLLTSTAGDVGRPLGRSGPASGRRPC